MIRIGVLSNDKIFLRWLPEFYFRQNGAPSGLEKRGLDASIYHKTRKPTEGTKSLSVQRTEDRRTSLRSF
ncbi:hypothetical protein C4Q31_06275 [Leptospira borgpetersenii serovar Ceylonica]|nr:hypothetical protein C4Q31_06275 [Leptospira borgpetersenii serovar Ceylonica]QHH64984.1 hypothetical protein GS521_13795 [Leptospira borgpetersenii]